MDNLLDLSIYFLIMGDYMFDNKVIRLSQELIQTILDKNPYDTLKCSKKLSNN